MRINIHKGYQSITLTLASIGILATAALATYDRVLAVTRGGTGLSSVGSANTLLKSTGSALAFTSTVNIPLVIQKTDQGGSGTLSEGFNLSATNNATFDLPDASTMLGQTITMKSQGATNITLTAAAGDSIDGVSTYVLVDADSAVTLYAHSANAWFVE